MDRPQRRLLRRLSLLYFICLAPLSRIRWLCVRIRFCSRYAVWSVCSSSNISLFWLLQLYRKVLKLSSVSAPISFSSFNTGLAILGLCLLFMWTLGYIGQYPQNNFMGLRTSLCWIYRSSWEELDNTESSYKWTWTLSPLTWVFFDSFNQIL